MNGLELGYLCFEVADLGVWTRFAEDMLGLAPKAIAPGQIGLRADERSHRFLLEEGPRDDLTAIGVGSDDAQTFERAIRRLSEAGYEVELAHPDLVAKRQVKQLVLTTEPSGLRVEVFHGLAREEETFTSHLFPSGFVMGDQGIGHVLYWTKDLEATNRFWQKGLGYILSDTADQESPIGLLEAVFLHSNARHHSIAYASSPVPMPKRCHHFLLEVGSVRDVGLSFERAHRLGVPLLNGLGQHPNDQMFSFYAATPSGFGFEIGMGGLTVDETWETQHFHGFSAWGHAPASGAWARSA